MDIKSTDSGMAQRDNRSMQKAQKPAKPRKDPAVSQFYKDFRDRLVRLRLDSGYSQDDFADLLTLPRANYKKYEIRSKFPLHAVPKLAQLTKQSVDFVVTGRNAKSFVPRVASRSRED